jgi:hypothetical protein
MSAPEQCEHTEFKICFLIPSNVAIAGSSNHISIRDLADFPILDIYTIASSCGFNVGTRQYSESNFLQNDNCKTLPGITYYANIFKNEGSHKTTPKFPELTTSSRRSRPFTGGKSSKVMSNNLFNVLVSPSGHGHTPIQTVLHAVKTQSGLVLNEGGSDIFGKK